MIEQYYRCKLPFSQANFTKLNTILKKKLGAHLDVLVPNKQTDDGKGNKQGIMRWIAPRTAINNVAYTWDHLGLTITYEGSNSPTSCYSGAYGHVYDAVKEMSKGATFVKVLNK